MSNFKNMKFRVNNPEHSKQIQEALFELGYAWRKGGENVHCNWADYLYSSSDGKLTVGVFDNMFKENKNTECNLSDLLMMIGRKKLNMRLSLQESINYLNEIYAIQPLPDFTTPRTYSDEYHKWVCSAANKPQQPKDNPKQSNMKYPNSVIRVDKEEDQQEKKPVEFTHCFWGDDGWVATKIRPDKYRKIVYLGKCDIDGDMFAAYNNDNIEIFKGHLNSGRY